ncbi:MAG: hypothetical protein U5R48_15165 [Gammaproteobacteria bacterium]|nr:hypothetical protein [Gammaproteobacteria bacterium]
MHRFTDSAIRAPGSALTGNGDPYKVFTPFRRNGIGELQIRTGHARWAPPRENSRHLQWRASRCRASARFRGEAC